MNTLSISFEGLMLREKQKAFDALEDRTKIQALQALINAARSGHRETDDDKKLLEEHFGDNAAKVKEFVLARLMYTLDASGSYFRCWHASFGAVHRTSSSDPFDHFHFDSCGQGLLFCARSTDKETLRPLIESLTSDRIEWRSDYGTLWAGFFRR